MPRSLCRFLALAVLLTLPHAVSPAQQPTHAPPEKVLRGIVFDADGTCVEGAAISFSRFDAPIPTTEILTAPQTRSRADGGYELSVPHGVHGHLAVTAPGRQVCTLDVPADGHPTSPRAFLLPGHTLHGRVRDAEGGPVGGAVITVTDAIPFARGAICRPRSVAISDERGFFSAPGVPANGLRVTVEARDFRPVELLAHRQTPLDLTLESARWIRGTVVDREGRPVAGANARIRGASMAALYRACLTDAAGRFELPHTMAFPLRVEAFLASRRFESALLTEPTADVEVTPVRTAAAVEVRVTDRTTGEAIDHFWASVVGTPSAEPDPQLALQQHLHARVASHQGLRHVANDRGYRHAWVVVDAEGHGFEFAALPERATEVSIALDREAPITGVVVDENGVPVRGAAVRALPRGRRHGLGQDPRLAGVLTDADGAFAIPRLRPGAYHVQAWADGRRTSAPVEVQAGYVDPDPCRIELPAKRYLRAKVRGAVAEGPVPALCLDGTMNAGKNRQDGDFAYFDVVAAQRALLFATGDEVRIPHGMLGRLEPHFWFPSRIRLGDGLQWSLDPISTGATGIVVLDLPEPRSEVIVGRVVLPKGVPAERIAVKAQLAGDPRQVAQRVKSTAFAGLDADGTFELEVVPGTYIVQLLDLETDIAFHTEAPRVELPQPSGDALTLAPRVHWLDVGIVEVEGADAVADCQVRVSMARPDNAPAAFHGISGERRGIQFRDLRLSHGSARRWLVPAGKITLQAGRYDDALRPGGGALTVASMVQSEPVDVVVERAEHDATLRLPPLPPADALRSPR